MQYLRHRHQLSIRRACARLNFQLSQFYSLHLGPCTTLIGEFKSSTCFQINFSQQIAANTLVEHIVCIFFGPKIKGRVAE